MDAKKLQLLEDRVDEVLTGYESLCAERDHLRRQLGEAESRAEQAVSRLRESEEARSEIKARVERILGRLDALGLGS